MLTTVGDFFKSTFGESLKKPLQPAGIFAASIFVLLNAALIYPKFIARNDPVAVVIRDAGSVWQATLTAAIVLVLAYLLISMSSTILKLMTGELWDQSPIIATYFIKQARIQIDRVTGIDEPSGLHDSRDWLKSHERLFAELPDDPARATPTALGNVLAATASYLRRRYGIELAAVWGHMESVLGSEPALAARLNDEKSTLDFLSNLAFVLVLFAFEHACVGFILHDAQAPLSVLFVVLAWAVYRAAVDKARAWSAEIRMAFDLHRDKLRSSLGLPEFTSDAAERSAWRSISRALQTGGLDWQPRGVALVPVVTHSVNARATLEWHSERLVARAAPPPTGASQTNPVSASSALASPAESTLVYQREYLLFVSRAPESGYFDPASGLHVLVVDPRVTDPVAAPCELNDAGEPVLRTNRSSDTSTESAPPWMPSVIPPAQSGASIGVLWRHPLPVQADSLVLHYGLPLWSVGISLPTGVKLDGSRAHFNAPPGLVVADISFEFVVGDTLTIPPGQVHLRDPRLSSAATAVRGVASWGIDEANAVHFWAARPSGSVEWWLPNAWNGPRLAVRYLVLQVGEVATPADRQIEAILSRIEPPTASVSTDSVTHDGPVGPYLSMSARLHRATSAAASVLELDRLIAAQQVAVPQEYATYSLALGRAWATLRNWDAAEQNFERARSLGAAPAATYLHLIDAARQAHAK